MSFVFPFLCPQKYTNSPRGWDIEGNFWLAVKDPTTGEYNKWNWHNGNFKDYDVMLNNKLGGSPDNATLDSSQWLCRSFLNNRSSVKLQAFVSRFICSQIIKYNGVIACTKIRERCERYLVAFAIYLAIKFICVQSSLWTMWTLSCSICYISRH